MDRIKSKSDKRLIVETTVNNKTAYFLIDTGASVGMIDSNQRKKYDLEKGKKYSGTLVGAGGEIKDVHHCNVFVNIKDTKIPQFLLADISQVVQSIEAQTGIRILGIISLTQCKIANISLDCNDNEIILE
jgi:predicted aspartyl protease